MPAIMVDDWGTRGTSTQAAKQWLQFWRLHPVVNTATSREAQDADDGTSRVQ